MEVYAAMIDRMDQGIGKIVAELKRTGQFDNTLILYLQDNGGCAEAMGRTPQPKKGHPNIERPDEADAPADEARGVRGLRQRAGADARRLPGPHGPEGDARRAGHLHRLRPGLGQRLQHAVPRVQALGPRRRHQHAAHRPLAEGHRREGRTAQAARPSHRHHRDVRANLAGAKYPKKSARRRSRRWRAGASCRHSRTSRSSATPLLGARGQPRHPRRRLETRRQARRSRGNSTTSRRTASNRPISPRSNPTASRN